MLSRNISLPVVSLLTILFFVTACGGGKEAKEFIRTMPADKIREIRLEPVDNKSLVDKPVIISDKVSIAEIAAALRAATAYSPNRHDTAWSLTVRIIADKEYGGTLTSTKDGAQGVYLRYKSNIIDGVVYGAYRNDALGALIEKFAHAVK